MKHDRIMAGAIAGCIGTAAQNIYGQTAKALGITDRAFLDFARIILFHKSYGGVFGFIAGFIAHLTFGMLSGALFAYVIRKSSSTHLYFKGSVMGAAIWFFSLGIGTLYNLPMFVDIPPIPALSIFVGALIWGLVTAFSLKILEKKTNLI
ncbi:MAG: hypothetical protein RO469_11805 [Thermincola sp.]|jgi:hypothetical protein|nr:hypothetical protein [Thermincola sp.]MDT3703525.1 hypothetical protein [Thermincola sp.]